MSALTFIAPSCASWGSKSISAAEFAPSVGKYARMRSRVVPVKSCLFDSFENEPILKEALKEPVAFMGGMFAGLLRLDLNEEPLKEWIQRTVEASGVTQEVTNGDSGESEEEVLQPIEKE